MRVLSMTTLAQHITMEKRINLIIFCPVRLSAPGSLASHHHIPATFIPTFFNDDCCCSTQRCVLYIFFFFFVVVSYSSGGTIRDGEEPFICPGPSWRYMTWIIGLLLFLFPKSNRKLFGTNVSPHFAISSMVLDIKTPRPRSSPPADSSLSFSSTFEKIFLLFFSTKLNVLRNVFSPWYMMRDIQQRTNGLNGDISRIYTPPPHEEREESHNRSASFITCSSYLFRLVTIVTTLAAVPTCCIHKTHKDTRPIAVYNILTVNRSMDG